MDTSEMKYECNFKLITVRGLYLIIKQIEIYPNHSKNQGHAPRNLKGRSLLVNRYNVRFLRQEKITYSPSKSRGNHGENSKGVILNELNIFPGIRPFFYSRQRENGTPRAALF